MSYRANYQRDSLHISDVFDGHQYWNLLSETVTIDGVPCNHRFFSEARDVAIGMMMDGFQIFKRARGGTASCWPIIGINLNLPPEIRTHLSHIIPIGLIAGPDSPKDFNSYLRPFIDECKLLARGVRAFDAISDSGFDLHIYPISIHGDIQAIKHATNLKGPNSMCPCRACRIAAIRDTKVPASTYYVPLRQPKKPGTEDLTWDPYNLPLRADAEYHEQIREIQAETAVGRRKALCQEYGITGECDLLEIPSIRLSSSFPHDWMHLFLENHCKNLILLWTGRYKGLSEGREDYRIRDAIWETIGKETAACGATIPSAFSRRTPNIATEKRNFTAEDWMFWFVHIAPHVLNGRFPREKYYKHFMKLNNIMKICLQYSISRDEVLQLRSLIVDYVHEYEKYGII